MQSDLGRLESIFKEMVFDTQSPLQWSFYFVDNNKSHLEKVYDEMKDHDYKIEKLEKNDNEEWTLQVSKVDVLTPEKLHKRNIAFNELAEYCNVTLYDGWDVEEVTPLLS